MLIQLLFVLLGGLLSLGVAAIVSLLQFETSQANYRLKRVTEATQVIIQEFKSTRADLGPKRNNYRYSFGVVFDNLASTFGTTGKDGIPPRAGKYPILINETGDKWGLFNDYIRPVISDLNSHNVFGVLFLFHKFKKLRVLIALCEQLENVVGNLDAITHIEKTQGMSILNFKNAIEINETQDVNANYHIGILKQNFEELNNCWQKWVRISI